MGLKTTPRIFIDAETFPQGATHDEKSNLSLHIHANYHHISPKWIYRTSRDRRTRELLDV